MDPQYQQPQGTPPAQNPYAQPAYGQPQYAPQQNMTPAQPYATPQSNQYPQAAQQYPQAPQAAADPYAQYTNSLQQMVPSPQQYGLPAYDPNAAAAMAMPRQKKSKKLLIIVVLLVLGTSGFIGFAAMRSGKKDGGGSQAVTAESVLDFSAVCSGGTVSNATAYAGGPVPHPIATFTKQLDGTYAEQPNPYKDKTWRPDAKKVSAIQLVACLDRKEGTEKRAKTCNLKDTSNKALPLELYTTTYTMKVLEAKTGKSLESAKEIPGTSQACPTTNVTYDPTDPKIFSSPNSASIETAVKSFVTAKDTGATSKN